MVIDGSICSVYLVAVLGKDVDYSSRYQVFPQGLKCGNGLTSIELFKLLGTLISIRLGLLRSIPKILLNLEGCWVRVADSG